MILILFSLIAAAFAADRYQAETHGDGLILLRDNRDGLEARIAPQHGGELCSLRYRLGGEWIELLYRACDYTQQEGWRGKAPLLWPATGGTRGPYTVGGKRYQMPFHGFVQSMPWRADTVQAGEGEARALLSVTATEKTREVYPFGWRMSVEYRLREGRLHLVYTAGAAQANREPMPFSIGNHITFRVPFVAGSDAARMRLETPARGIFLKDADNLPTGKTGVPPFTGATELGKLPVKVPVSLGDYAADPVLVLADPKGLRLRMLHSASRAPAGGPYVQFNLWGDPQGGYYSPEPWVGMQNSHQSRRGLIELRPGEAWTWRVELYPVATATE